MGNEIGCDLNVATTQRRILHRNAAHRSQSVREPKKSMRFLHEYVWFRIEERLCQKVDVMNRDEIPTQLFQWRSDRGLKRWKTIRNFIAFDHPPPRLYTRDLGYKAIHIRMRDICLWVSSSTWRDVL
jgi:hypothetical protein